VTDRINTYCVAAEADSSGLGEVDFIDPKSLDEGTAIVGDCELREVIRFPLG
jgi:hypothetical protein